VASDFVGSVLDSERSLPAVAAETKLEAEVRATRCATMDHMNRRGFLIASGASLAFAAPATAPATVLFGENTIALDKARLDGQNLWVQSKDLPRINQFEVKPQGACRADVCIPLSKTLKNGDWFNLTGFARKIGETIVIEKGVYSFGEIPVLRGAFYNSRIAPDFAVPDRQGKVVHLSDFRGKKALVITWASW
jgi:hypothetical protein